MANKPDYLNRITRWGDTSWARDHSATLARSLGSYRTPTPSKELARALSRCSYATLPPGVLSVVTGRELTNGPEGTSDLDAFVRDAVTVAAPHTAYAASRLLSATSGYVSWCVRDMGWPLDVDVIWSVRAIDLYSTTANLELSEGTRRNYRGQLMRISEVLLPHEHPERPTPLSARRSSAPYTPTQMTAFRNWAGDQLTPQKRDRAMVMLVLCAGAGLRPNELPLVFPAHVVVDEAGILVTVPGENTREVPLLSEWEEWMVVLLERRRADESLWGNVNRRTTHNLTSSFTENSHGNPPRADRLRHTWFVRHLTAGVPMKDLFRAGGFTKMQQLHLLLEFIELRDEADYRRIFRAEDQA
ncbi:hypothetical protein [Microbacterium sp. P04]|uniref:hypothetical protein n=1 Tax=Microbacterium sp. P04 TaxID=3366947 RepID=UPI00374662D5